jgi:acyl carrier protein phosphodiesterase
MNWLAHLVLSEATPAFRVGNVLADVLTIGELRALPDAFQAGIARHRAIDSFTDKHAVYRRSVARLQPPFRRYGGVIIDVVYDHLLTVDWDRYSDTPLELFAADVQRDVDLCRPQIPEKVHPLFERMHTGAWLTSNSDLEGVRVTLNRISKRLRRPFDLGAAANPLSREYDALSEDFREFFPQIRTRFVHS